MAHDGRGAARKRGGMGETRARAPCVEGRGEGSVAGVLGVARMPPACPWGWVGVQRARRRRSGWQGRQRGGTAPGVRAARAADGGGATAVGSGGDGGGGGEGGAEVSC